MQRLTYGKSLGNYIDNCQLSMATTTGRDHMLAARLVNSWFHVCTSLAPKTSDYGFWFGDETTCALAYNIRKLGVLRNGQQPGRAMNSFINQGEFVNMKTLSGRRAPSCDKHRFCDKMTST